ncbi:hypothetical protein [Mucilaginibacter sp.]
MKKILLLSLLLFVLTQKPFAQTTASGPVERKLTGALCSCIGTIDQSKLTTAKEATDAFMKCFLAQSDLLVDLAAEKHVDMEDKQAMHELGVEIGKELVKEKCPGFLTLAVKMSGKTDDDIPPVNAMEGTFKRINNKGFNFIVLTDGSGNEKTFLWLRQFAGSEKFMGETTKYIGKKLKISWQDIEVYLPQAKGYYKVKEITGIEVL